MAVLLSHNSSLMGSDATAVKEQLRRLMVLANEAGLKGLRATGFKYERNPETGGDVLVVITEDMDRETLENTMQQIRDLESTAKALREQIEAREEIRREIVTRTQGGAQ